MTSTLDAALDYAARGWPVLPLRPRAKVPATAHGLHDATTDEATIRRWWEREPAASVGLRSGERFDVLDVDGDEGLDELGRLLGAGDASRITDRPLVRTPGGGAHLYFAPTGLGNRARLRPGIDWRGSGGYVVAPPSVGANGLAYEWHVDRDGSFGPDVALPPAPGWLHDLLDPARGNVDGAVRATGAVRAGDPTRSRSYARAALEDEVERVATAPAGTRNDTLCRAAFSLGQLVGAGFLDIETVASHLLGAALRAGLPDSEARRTLTSGLEAGIAHPREVSA